MSRQHPDAKPPFRQPDSPPGERPRCRWCWGPVGKGRQSWCSNVCVTEYKELHDWTSIRWHVEKRDRGICAACGCDTEKLKRVFHWLRRRGEYPLLREVQSAMRFKTSTYDLWQADHIQARHLGGDNRLVNLRTLCLACHKAVTARQARERAQARRAGKAQLFTQETHP